jgi:hypothetical protein
MLIVESGKRCAILDRCSLLICSRMMVQGMVLTAGLQALTQCTKRDMLTKPSQNHCSRQRPSPIRYMQQRCHSLSPCPTSKLVHKLGTSLKHVRNWERGMRYELAARAKCTDLKCYNTRQAASLLGYNSDPVFTCMTPAIAVAAKTWTTVNVPPAAIHEVVQQD